MPSGFAYSSTEMVETMRPSPSRPASTLAPRMLGSFMICSTVRLISRPPFGILGALYHSPRAGQLARREKSRRGRAPRPEPGVTPLAAGNQQHGRRLPLALGAAKCHNYNQTAMMESPV